MTIQSERLHRYTLVTYHIFTRDALPWKTRPTHHAPSIFSEQASYQASDSYPLSWNTTNSSAILSSLPENFSSCLKTVLQSIWPYRER